MLDLAIVCSCSAQALDKDKNGEYIFQEEFRDPLVLCVYMSFGASMSSTPTLNNFLLPKALTAQEQSDFFVERHLRATEGNPLLSGHDMDTFLDVQVVRKLNISTFKAQFTWYQIVTMAIDDDSLLDCFVNFRQRKMYLSY